MVDKSDISKINALSGELQTISVALTMFDSGGRIVSMTVASAQSGPVPLIMPGRITIATATMAYPQTMIDAIKQYLGNREQEIQSEITGLGVTGVEAR